MIIISDSCRYEKTCHLFDRDTLVISTNIVSLKGVLLFLLLQVDRMIVSKNKK